MGRYAFRHGGRGDPARRGRGAGIALALAMLVAAGCTPVSSTGDVEGTSNGDLVEIDVAATWSAIRDAQADRLDALATFSTAGDATMRFTDADGDRRTEQVDLRLWRVAPVQAAVRLAKVGTSFLLAGWNDERWWLLDESKGTPVLLIRRPGVDDAGGAAALLSPPTLLAMLGLLPWPETPPDSLRARRSTSSDGPVSIEFELARVGWPTGDGDLVVPGRLRVEIRRPGDGPVRVELLDEAGRSIAVSELERPLPVECRGRPPGAWPTLSHRMRVTRWNGDEVVVRLDRPLAGGEVSPRLFDLDVIRGRVPNVVVDDLTGAIDGGDS